MTRFRLIALLFLSITVVSLAVAFYSHKPDTQTAPSGKRVLYYRDPMHPSYTSDRPGTAPDCGMALEPVYAGEHAAETASIHASPAQQQTIGVRLATVEKSAAARAIRALGRVSVEESRVFPLITAADGWVQKVFPLETGSTVRKGQPLVSVYGREYLNSQRAYVYALRTVETALTAPGGEYQDQPKFALQEARLNLQNMGISEAQIQQITASRQALLEVNLTAPGDGVVLARNVYPQQRFERGVELLRIADLSSVWIVADLFGEDISYVHPGTVARVTVPGAPGKTAAATVTGSVPRFDADARATQIRLKIANPGLALRPDMFVDVEFPAEFPATVHIPVDAVLDSGRTKTVFVQKNPGTFEPRTVETGWQSGGRVQILRGLEPGEIIVVSGNFLLDSESRMQRGAAGHD